MRAGADTPMELTTTAVPTSTRPVATVRLNLLGIATLTASREGDHARGTGQPHDGRHLDGSVRHRPSRNEGGSQPTARPAPTTRRPRPRPFISGPGHGLFAAK